MATDPLHLERVSAAGRAWIDRSMRGVDLLTTGIGPSGSHLRQTGEDMRSEDNRMSLGGLAVTVVEC